MSQSVTPTGRFFIVWKGTEINNRSFYTVNNRGKEDLLGRTDLPRRVLRQESVWSRGGSVDVDKLILNRKQLSEIETFTGVDTVFLIQFVA